MVGKSFLITGDGAAHTFSSALASFLGVTDPGFECKWLQITSPPSNAAVGRVGGSEVSSTVGYEIPVGWSGQFLPPISEYAERYKLKQQFYYLGASDVFQCLYGVD